MHGTVSGEPITPTWGVLQGYPFSLLKLLAQTACAAHFIHQQVKELTEGNVEMALFFDDLFMWATQVGHDSQRRNI